MTEDAKETQRERPLVTFALFAYNQEKYIREAVEGAFSQTYEPLEIILSDDCSSDRTFEIMQKMAVAYNGPHKVRVRRSEVNSGIGAHVYTVLSMSKGSIFVLAAGDDISEECRSEVIVREFANHPRRMFFISALESIEDGRLLMPDPPYSIDDLATRKKYITGAGAAYRSDLIRRFPAFVRHLHNEDDAMAMRGLLIGDGPIESKLPLVRYRASVGVSSESRGRIDRRFYRSMRLVDINRRLALFRQWTKDFKQMDLEGRAYLFRDSRLECLFLKSLMVRGWPRMKIIQEGVRCLGLKRCVFHLMGAKAPTFLNCYLKIRHRQN